MAKCFGADFSKTGSKQIHEHPFERELDQLPPSSYL